MELEEDAPIHIRDAALHAITAIMDQYATLERHLEECVMAARGHKASWADIGSAQGITRQAAHARWAKG